MNKVFLIGNLTREPELTETTNGVLVCRFTIAVGRKYSGADGEKKTDFFNCVAWRGLGETVAKFTHKGSKVAVSGSIELRTYENSDGEKKTAVDIVVQDVEFLTAKQSDEQEQEKPSSNKGNAARQLQAFDDDGDIPF